MFQSFGRQRRVGDQLLGGQGRVGVSNTAGGERKRDISVRVKINTTARAGRFFGL